MTWQLIDTAPKDGSRIWVRRIYKGDKIYEGWAVWASMAANAPMRFPSPGGLDGDIPADNEFADQKAWCTEDKRFHVPGPTEWAPGGPASA